jgi:hypothetical protein
MVQPPVTAPPALVAFLTQLAVALHKTRAYPPGHPMRQDAVSAAFGLLEAAFAGRTSLTIGVTRSHLLIDGTPIDADNFILRDFAARLNRLHLGAVVIRAGAGATDLAAAIDQLARESARPLSRDPAFEPIGGGSVELVPITYRALALQANEEGDADAPGSDLLWRRLVASSFAGGGFDESTTAEWPTAPVAQSPAPDWLVKEVIARLSHPEVRGALAAAIDRAGRERDGMEPERRRALEANLASVIAKLSPDALQVLLDFDLGRADDLDRLRSAAEWLPVGAVVDLIGAAARARGEELSTYLVRLFRKLAAAGPRRDSALDLAISDVDGRSILTKLLANWTLDSPNPWEHTAVLESLARFDGERGTERCFGEGLRLVMIALETDSAGEAVLEGVDLALEAGDLGPLVQELDQASPDGRAASAIWARLLEPATLRRVLTGPKPDLAALSRLLDRVGEGDIPLVLEALGDVEDAALRRLVLERVVGFGTAGAAHLVRHLEAVSPAALRDLIGLLAELPELPDGLSLRAHAGAADPLIRRDAYRVMLRCPTEREEAVHGALADPDERVVRVAVDAGREHFPRGSLARLMALLNTPGRSEELRARAVPILGQFDSLAVRQWLLGGMVVRTRWFRRLRLAPVTPVVLAKLRVIAERWADHPDAERIMRLARASRDPQVGAAIRVI